jgi:5'-methylthioadenosine phosphorylase
MTETVSFAVIGGSGLYGMSGLKDTKEYDLDTPFGKPSAPIVVGTLEGQRVAFLARHGLGHHITPSEVNYRANIHALKGLGAKQIISVSACGSLRDDYAPGHIVIPDQIFDNTKGRERTFFGEGLVAHVSIADPFCKTLSDQLESVTREAGATTHRGGTFITIEGPRFSTKAESTTYRSWGMSLIGMTTSPEAFLAREAEIAYATIAHITDYDSWHVSEEPVTVDKVIATMRHNVEIVQMALAAAVESLNEESECACHHALETALLTDRKAIPQTMLERLKPIVGRYFGEG